MILLILIIKASPLYADDFGDVVRACGFRVTGNQNGPSLASDSSTRRLTYGRVVVVFAKQPAGWKFAYGTNLTGGRFSNEAAYRLLPCLTKAFPGSEVHSNGRSQTWSHLVLGTSAYLLYLYALLSSDPKSLRRQS